METVLITNGKRTIEVTQKAYEVVFKERGFKPVEDHHSLDLFGKTIDELEEYTIPQLKKFLDQEEIEYRSRASKDELIALVIGDETDGTNGTENTTTDRGDGHDE